MSAPVPALGGARPLHLMETMTGQALVSQVLAQRPMADIAAAFHTT